MSRDYKDDTPWLMKGRKNEGHPFVYFDKSDNLNVLYNEVLENM